MKERTSAEWICTARHCRRLGRLGPIASRLKQDLPRLRRDTWVRYRMPLAHLPPLPEQVTLTPIDDALMEKLRRHPESDEHQVRSALRFWESGFGEGFLWLESNEPLCMIWLVTRRHEAARNGLGIWAGMYPPVAEGTGVAEGIYSFRRGLRRPGGAASAMAIALFHAARRAGLTELRTHVHSENAAAQRWAARVGWQPIGTVHRLLFDLPGLRGSPIYIHEIDPVEGPDGATPTRDTRPANRTG